MKATKRINRSDKSSHTIALAVMLAIAAVSCRNQNEHTTAPAPVAAVPVMEPVLAALLQSNEETAIRYFLKADWSARPLFASNSVLNLRPSQFSSMPPAESDKKWREVMEQVSTLNRFAAAVDRAGREAAARQHLDLAKRHFDALRRCGQALDKPDWLVPVQAIGRVMKTRADIETKELLSRAPATGNMPSSNRLVPQSL